MTEDNGMTAEYPPGLLIPVPAKELANMRNRIQYLEQKIAFFESVTPGVLHKRIEEAMETYEPLLGEKE